ncbi:MAG: hypothetical protein ACRBBN_14095 [Methyloligellaceae bacterium]
MGFMVLHTQLRSGVALLFIRKKAFIGFMDTQRALSFPGKDIRSRREGDKLRRNSLRPSKLPNKINNPSIKVFIAIQEITPDFSKNPAK